MKKEIFTITTILLALFSSCNDGNESNEGSDIRQNHMSSVVITGDAEAGVTYVNIDGTVNLSLITIDYSSLTMGAEVSTDVTFKHPIKSTSNQLEGNYAYLNTQKAINIKKRVLLYRA